MHSDSRSQTRSLGDLFYLLALSLFFLLSGLGRGSLASWDEGLYASVAKEMFLSGDWFHLTYGGQTWVDKPPLALWATSFFYGIFGINEFSSRLFSALCGCGIVLMTYLLGCRLFNRWIGFLSAFVLLNSSHFLRFSRFGMLDAPLTLFLCLCLYFFWRGRERNRYFIFSGIALGLALMTKGFAALLVFPVIWLYCLWADELELLGRSSYWIGVMLAVAIALPWHVFEVVSTQGGFMKDIVVKHLLQRTTTAVEGHTGNWYFYIRTFINKYHPWVLVAIFSAPYFLYKAVRTRLPEYVFVACWTFSLWALITAIRTKLPWYIFPIYPALSITVGYMLAKAVRDKHKRIVQLLCVGAMAIHIPLTHLWEADYSRHVKGLSAFVTSSVPADATVHLYNYHGQPEATFYFGRKTAYLDDVASFEKVSSGSGFFCLVFEKDRGPLETAIKRHGLAPLSSFEGAQLLGRKGRAS